ncbi:phosphatase PAP2 family protein [Acidocella sp.]|uniref:phosphatase PAP2 family protein n=2 Tax=Acidocella sp. TaxID=50710 RepID=UPI002621E333|nr:phosphatase PAP2 family protein [Acidocella sp.]
MWLCLGLLAASLLCAATIDRPVARFFAVHPGWRPWFQACATPSLLPLPLSGLYLCAAALRLLPARLAAGPWLAMSLATITATAAKDELKFLLGRAWPQWWLKDGVYGFHPLATSYLYGAYPSGHTAYMSAPLAVLWVVAPRARPWAVLVLALVMAGLVGADYHFIGDVLAGLAVGLLSAAGTLRLLAARHG